MQFPIAVGSQFTITQFNTYTIKQLKMKKIIEKTVNLNLIGVNGNAYAIMGVFRKQARKEGWNKEEIKAVIDVAKSKDYNHLWATIENHCEPLEDDFHTDEDES